MVDLVDGTSYIEPLLCSWDKVSFIKLDDIFDLFLGLVCEYLIEHFCINVHKGNWSEVLLLCWVFVRSWYRHITVVS